MQKVSYVSSPDYVPDPRCTRAHDLRIQGRHNKTASMPRLRRSRQKPPESFNEHFGQWYWIEKAIIM